MNRGRLGLLTMALTSALALAACNPSIGGDGGDGGTARERTVIVGSADFAENSLIALIYARALTAKGVKVSTKLDFGSRETYLPALTGGRIDVVPEYTGNLLLNYAPDSTGTSPADVYAALTPALPPSLMLLDRSAAQNKDSYTVTGATAAKYRLRSIADLAPVAARLTLGGASTLRTRPYGIPGLRRTYGVTFGSFSVLDPGGPLTVNALASGDVQVADLFTTDANIATNGWVVLADPKEMIPAQNVTPLITRSAASDAVRAALNAVSARLTTAGLLAMNKQVSDGADPSAVAQRWLSTNGLA